MTRDQLLQVIMWMPEFRALEIPDSDESKFASALIDMVAGDIAISHEWDMALKTANETIVASQKQYTLQGDNTDCRSIFNVRYGKSTDADDDFRELEKMMPGDVDNFLTSHNVTGVAIWVPDGRVDDYPRIRIIDPGTDTAYVLRYRYWRNDIKFEELPGTYDLAVLAGVRYALVNNNYERELGRVIDNQDPGGAGIRPMRLGYYDRERNIWRNRQFGWGG